MILNIWFMIIIFFFVSCVFLIFFIFKSNVKKRKYSDMQYGFLFLENNYFYFQRFVIFRDYLFLEIRNVLFEVFVNINIKLFLVYYLVIKYKNG